MCTDALYKGIPESLFLKFMYLATEVVEFSFNDIMYAQIDRVLMSNLLGPILANIFVGFYENLLFEKCHMPYVYYRYVDDTSFCFQFH